MHPGPSCITVSNRAYIFTYPVRRVPPVGLYYFRYYGLVLSNIDIVSGFGNHRACTVTIVIVPKCLHTAYESIIV